MIVYADNHFVECCSKTGKYTKLTTILHENKKRLPEAWRTKKLSTRGILFPQSHLGGLLAKKSDTIMFYDDKYVSVLDRHSVMNNSFTNEHKIKKAKKEDGKPSSDKDSDVVELMRMTQRYEHLAFLSTLPPENGDDLNSALVVIEVKPSALEAQLPASLKQKKFGAM